MSFSNYRFLQGPKELRQSTIDLQTIVKAFLHDTPPPAATQNVEGETIIKAHGQEYNLTKILQDRPDFDLLIFDKKDLDAYEGFLRDSANFKPRVELSAEHATAIEKLNISTIGSTLKTKNSEGGRIVEFPSDEIYNMRDTEKLFSERPYAEKLAINLYTDDQVYRHVNRLLFDNAVKVTLPSDSKFTLTSYIKEVLLITCVAAQGLSAPPPPHLMALNQNTDLSKYDISSMPKDDKAELEKHKLYIDVDHKVHGYNSVLRYKVLTPDNKILQGYVTPEELKLKIPEMKHSHSIDSFIAANSSVILQATEQHIQANLETLVRREKKSKDNAYFIKLYEDTTARRLKSAAKIGDYLMHPAFTSSSASAKGVENFGSDTFLFITQSKNRHGKNIAPLSFFAAESEVLFSPGTQFQYLDSQEQAKGDSKTYTYHATPLRTIENLPVMNSDARFLIHNFKKELDKIEDKTAKTEIQRTLEDIGREYTISFNNLLKLDEIISKSLDHTKSHGLSKSEEALLSLQKTMYEVSPPSKIVLLLKSLQSCSERMQNKEDQTSLKTAMQYIYKHKTISADQLSQLAFFVKDYIQEKSQENSRLFSFLWKPKEAAEEAVLNKTLKIILDIRHIIRTDPEKLQDHVEKTRPKKSL